MATRLESGIDFHEQRFLMFVVDQMAHDLEKKGERVIRMTLGKSELPPHADIVSAMTKAMEDYRLSSQVYPAGLPELREELAAYYREKYGTAIPPERFIVGAGTSGLFRNLFQLLLKPGDEVLIPDPYYSLYRFSALLAGAEIRYYRIDPETMRVDMSSFRDSFSSRTKIVVLNSPGNPLGNVLTREEMLEIDRIVDGRAVIVSDEIYANMGFDAEPITVAELGATRSAFVTTNAFSKGHRMYARRVGYCIAPEELVEPLTVVQHHTMLTVDPVAQYGAIAALGLPEEVERLAESYASRRDYTLKRLGESADVQVLRSEGGFYITLDCERFMKRRGMADSLELACDILAETSVAVVPGSDFGMDTALRLSFSSLEYEEGIDRLAAYFEDDATAGNGG